MSGSPAKLAPSRIKLSLRTEESKPIFPMVISSFRKRKSVSVEKKIELRPSNKNEMSDDSELSLIIDCDAYTNAKKKRRICD